ncbi:MAG: universal stress protein [Hyphomicrobiaceae bacterium]|nr:universal stress protein [Hyphomicrobiaceae bacterium]
MGYKTILVHFNDERRVAQLLSAGMELARRSNGHLIGLYVLPPIVIAPAVAVPYGGEVITAHRDFCRQEAERIKAAFDKATAGQSFVAEWRLNEELEADVGDVVMQHGRAADLIIASQADADWDRTVLLDVPDRLALESGRPALVVPNVGTYATIGQNVCVAWNGSRESARALFDALPLLQNAKSVRLLWVNPEDDAERSGDLPGVDIAATLARHGIKIEASTSVGTDIGVGDELLSRIADLGSDLLVMGCYGHSRLRELVFGGATRHILRHMTVPVLMSH